MSSHRGGGAWFLSRAHFQSTYITLWISRDIDLMWLLYCTQMEEEARTLHRNGLVGSQMKKTAAAYVTFGCLHLQLYSCILKKFILLLASYASGICHISGATFCLIWLSDRHSWYGDTVGWFGHLKDQEVAWVAVFNYHIALLNSQIDIYCSSTPLPHYQLQRSGSE